MRVFIHGNLSQEALQIMISNFPNFEVFNQSMGHFLNTFQLINCVFYDFIRSIMGELTVYFIGFEENPSMTHASHFLLNSKALCGLMDGYILII